MLTQLYLKNYALFPELQLDIPPGLNILTGETGAGKSLLVGALGLIIGRRADHSVLMASGGEGKCVIEARFERLSPRIAAQIQAFEDFDFEGSSLLIRREISSGGKSRAFINDTPVSLDTLREVSAWLLDLHSQHENQALLAPEKQRELLDAYAGCEADVLRFGEMLRDCERLQRKIQELEAAEQRARQQLDYYRFQVEELGSARPEAGEELRLEEELNLLQHAEEMREVLGRASEALYQSENSIYSQLSATLDPLRKAGSLLRQVAGEYERLNELRESLKDAAFTFQNLLDSVESDPERLAFIDERLGLYHRLKLKYNVKSGDELIALLEQVSARLGEFESLGGAIAAHKAELAGKVAALSALGLGIEQRRLDARLALETEIGNLLAQVGFLKARFWVSVERAEDPAGLVEAEGKRFRAFPSGINKVLFLIQPNPGLPPGPLSQIASGGEISRVMLAIKAVLAEKSEFPILIFDEIDTGISGEIANKVGALMQQLARRFQILSITHLPQIAAKGAAHFQISKQVLGNTTVSSIRQLSREERVYILAQMLSGEHPSDSALRNAAELIG